MFYAINTEAVNPEVLFTVETTPSIIDTGRAISLLAKLVTLEEAILHGTMVKNPNGKLVWLGVNLKLKLEEKVLYAWWLGKWRPVSYYSGRKAQPSHTWTMLQLNRVMRVNCPLDRATQIIYHWVA